MGSLTFNAGFAQEKTAIKGFRYKDIAVPIKKDRSDFDLEELRDIDAIKQSIKNILNWEKGQRILNPEFGNPLTPFLYEPMTNSVAKSIGAAIAGAITQWEPRVTIRNVNVEMDEDSHKYNITVIYSIPTLNVNPQTYTNILNQLI